MPLASTLQKMLRHLTSGFTSELASPLRAAFAGEPSTSVLVDVHIGVGAEPCEGHDTSEIRSVEESWRHREIKRKCYKNRGIVVEAPGIEPMKQSAEKVKRDVHMGSNIADSTDKGPPVLSRPVPSRPVAGCRVSGNRGNQTPRGGRRWAQMGADKIALRPQIEYEPKTGFSHAHLPAIFVPVWRTRSNDANAIRSHANPGLAALPMGPSSP